MAVVISPHAYEACAILCESWLGFSLLTDISGPTYADAKMHTIRADIFGSVVSTSAGGSGARCYGAYRDTNGDNVIGLAKQTDF